MIERDPYISDIRATTARLVGLDPSTKYRVTIRATTLAGIGIPYFIEVSTGDSIAKGELLKPALFQMILFVFCFLLIQNLYI